jgi:L,D-transpeptidase catalytic domain
MKLTRLLIIFIVGLVAISWFPKTAFWKKTKALHLPKAAAPTKPVVLSTKLKDKASEAKTFVKSKNYNEEKCFLIDMSLPSGSSRFYIYDLKKDTLQNAGLVAHGNCFEYWLEGRRYSNVVGSGCTSLGKYKIGSSYTGKFGYSYKLHGLEKTNDNAFERTVVLHSHSCVPNSETTDEICQSNGCPTVAPDFLKDLKSIINNSGKPVLLWIYE